MRNLPHHASLALFPETNKRARQFLEGCAARRDEKAERKDAEFFRLLAEQWIVRGCLDYVEEQAPATVARHIRQGLREFQTSLELGHKPNPWEGWEYFLAALAVSDRAMAHMVASLPEEAWAVRQSAALDWIVVQAKVAFALFRGEETETARRLADLKAFVFDHPLTPGFKEDLPEIQNCHRVLEGLHVRNGASFNREMTQRMELRAQSFRRHGTNAPIGALDLPGLGLCRLARERGLQIAVSHVYLPLALLDVP